MVASKTAAKKKPAAKTTKAAASAKTTAKKAVKAPVKKTAAKKVVAASTAAKKRPAAKKTTKKAESMQSFKVYKAGPSFKKATISRQTIYWIILLGVITASQLWILKIQLDIAELTNSVVTAQQEQ